MALIISKLQASIPKAYNVKPQKRIYLISIAETCCGFDAQVRTFVSSCDDMPAGLITGN